MKSKQLAEILPFVAVFLFVLYPEEMAMVSHSILGKLVVLAIIVYYTCIDAVYGFLVCVMFLFFYQTDLANNALNNVRSGWLIEEGLENLFQELETAPAPALDVGNDVSNYVYNPAYIEQQNEAHATETGPIRAIFTDNVWTGYNQYDASIFSYTPVVSPNAENERVLNASTERDLIRATFPGPGSSPSPAACSPDDVLCNALLKVDTEQLMIFPKDSNEGFVGQINSIWESVMGGVTDFASGHNANMWKTYLTA
jgi:hypothetical protein